MKGNVLKPNNIFREVINEFEITMTITTVKHQNANL